MGYILPLLICSALLLCTFPACSKVKEDNPKKQQGRTTPLHEEEDQVATIRDQVMNHQR